MAETGEAILTGPALRRREFVGAGLGWLALTGAAAPSFAVPVVDALALTIIDDKESFGPFLGDRTLPGLDVHYAGTGGAANGRMQRRALAAEFGLSILCDSRRAGFQRRVLVDFGYSAEAMANNLALLGIDPATIDAAVLSHGHLDHYGGFRALARDGKRRLPLYVGGEEAFCDRVAMVGNPPLQMGALDRGALARAGFDVRLAPEPATVADQAFTTGRIPLETFERAAIPTRMHPGIGCSRAALSPGKRDQAELADDGEHELATCYLLRGLGLVVIASCSHRGVLNSIRRAQAVSGERRVHMVIGGFHLVRPRTEDEARRTVTELATLNPRYVVPMHCTGETFYAEAMRAMPDRVIRPYVGMQLAMA